MKSLTVKKIGKFYNNKRVLDEISIHLKPGEIVGLLGPNGAGKTTCFYIISGLIKADYGSVYIDDIDVTTLPMYRRARLGLGYLPQENSIFRSMTVENNIMSVLEYTEKDPDQRESSLNQLLHEFSIDHLRHAQAQRLSGGERRRVEIARCLATKPQFILLDEPFAGVDPVSIKEIQSLILHLKKRGIGILITDHNVRESLELIDRAYIIYSGKVLIEGNAEEIVSNKEVRKVYLGDDFNL
jgi:lipopolysaccharide export system ATP-binding protein